MIVATLPQNPGPAAWNSILPKSKVFPPLEEPDISDWLIIGAGFAGLSAAKRLKELAPNDRIVVLEAKNLAEGPAGRNSGFMIDLPHDLTSEDYGGQLEKDKLIIAQNRQAIDFARESVSSLKIPKEAFKEVGKINAAATDSGLTHNSRYAEHLSKLGEPCKNYDAKTMREITGTNYYKGGLFTPGSVMLQPALYIRSLGKGLSSNKLRIFEHSPVLSLDRQGSSWVAKTPKGSISSTKVILAVNGHVENFGYFKRRLIHIFTYASMTRSLTEDECTKLGGRNEWGLTSANPLGTTIRRISGHSGNRIVIRNSATYEPKMKPKELSLRRIYKKHIVSFNARFPMLPEVSMDYNWGGHLTLSLNDVGAFGEIEKNLFSACCQNGLGTVRGTLQGIAAADLAMNNKTPLASQLLSLASPKRLPPEPLAKIGANLHLAWGEWRAGREL